MMKIILTLLLSYSLNLFSQEISKTKKNPAKIEQEDLSDSKTKQDSDNSEEQATSEKLPVKQHKFTLRGQLGLFSKYRIPDIDIDKKETDVFNAGSSLDRTGIFAIYKTNREAINPIPLNVGFEYRFQDRFRILFDQRHLDSKYNSTNQKIEGQNIFILGRNTLTLKGNYGFDETVQKFGIAYFHPINNFLKIGAILRNYRIEQNGRQTLKVSIDNPLALLPPPVTQEIESKTVYKGLVPGVGIEIPIGKNFEFRYTVELVNLKGIDNTKAITKFLFPVSIYSETSNLTYKGNIQNFEFGFHIPKVEFLTLRMGYTRERFVRSITERNSFSSEGIPTPRGYILSNALAKDIIVSNVNFDNLFFQFDCTVGF